MGNTFGASVAVRDHHDSPMLLRAMQRNTRGGLVTDLPEPDPLDIDTTTEHGLNETAKWMAEHPSRAPREPGPTMIAPTGREFRRTIDSAGDRIQYLTGSGEWISAGHIYPVEAPAVAALLSPEPAKLTTGDVDRVWCEALAHEAPAAMKRVLDHYLAHRKWSPLGNVVPGPLSGGEPEAKGAEPATVASSPGAISTSAAQAFPCSECGELVTTGAYCCGIIHRAPLPRTEGEEPTPWLSIEREQAAEDYKVMLTGVDVKSPRLYRWYVEATRQRAAREEAERERGEAETRVLELIHGSLNVQRMVVESGRFDLELGGKGALVISEALIALYRSGKGANNLEMRMTDSSTGELFAVTVQRVEGLSPAQQLAASQSAVATLMAKLEEAATESRNLAEECDRITRMLTEYEATGNPRHLVTKLGYMEPTLRGIVRRLAALSPTQEAKP